MSKYFIAIIVAVIFILLFIGVIGIAIFFKKSSFSVFPGRNNELDKKIDRINKELSN